MNSAFSLSWRPRRLFPLPSSLFPLHSGAKRLPSSFPLIEARLRILCANHALRSPSSSLTMLLDGNTLALLCTPTPRYHQQHSAASSSYSAAMGTPDSARHALSPPLCLCAFVPLCLQASQSAYHAARPRIRPPTTASTIPIPSSSLTIRAPMEMTLALLCSFASCALFSFQHTPQRHAPHLVRRHGLHRSRFPPGRFQDHSSPRPRSPPPGGHSPDSPPPRRCRTQNPPPHIPLSLSRRFNTSFNPYPA